MNKTRFLSVAALATLAALGGCAHKPVPYDYTAFKQANPRTLLVMPPVNESPEVKAGASVWAQATLPLYRIDASGAAATGQAAALPAGPQAWPGSGASITRGYGCHDRRA